MNPQAETPSNSKLPKIDFAGVDPAQPGTGNWNLARSQVMDALAHHGCFEAVYPRLSPELRSSLFGPGVEALFALPLEAKLRNVSDKPYHAYTGQIPGLDYESLAFPDPLSPAGVRSFADLMWPGSGNPGFCETVRSYSKELAAVEAAVRRMVAESIGAERHLAELTTSMWFLLRLSEYKAPRTEDMKLGLWAHTDTSFLTIINDNSVDGVEVEAKDGEWIRASLSADSLIVIAGDMLKAWTNGRVYSPMHRVVVGGGATRHSAILFSIPVDGFLVQAPEEAIDEAHPALYTPFEYNEFTAFRFTQELRSEKHVLEAFCGVAKTSQSEVEV